MNYTQDQTAYMVEEYQNKPTRITVDRLAKELGTVSYTHLTLPPSDLV